MKKNYLACTIAFLLLFGMSSSASAIDGTKKTKETTKTEDTIYYSPEENKIFGKTKTDSYFSLDGYWQPSKSSSANIDVVTRDDIKNQNTPYFSDLLNQLGSVTVQNSNGSEGSTTSVRIRGTDRVKMTIDGIKADRPSLTSAGVESQFLLLDDIELVEVIKGPQGNVSGTNASGGLVALQTRRGYGRTKFELGSDMGNYGEFKERFAVYGGNEKADYYLSTTWYKTNGGMWTDQMGSIYNDDYNNLSAVSNLGLRLLDNKAEIRDIFRFSRARKGIGINSTPLGQSYNDPNNYCTNVDIMNALVFKHTPKEWYDYDVKFGLYHNDNNNYSLQDAISPDEYETSKMSSTRLNFMTQHNFKYKDWNIFSLGYNLENENINSTTQSPLSLQGYNSDYAGSTLQNDVYVHDVINIKDILFIRGGARLIANSQYGVYVTPNASAALVLPTFKLKGAKTKFRGSWGQSVNTPTLYQRYGTLNSGWMEWTGNPDLKAEKMNSWDVGIEQSFFEDKLKFEFGYFNSNYNDYIGSYYDTDPITWKTYGYYANIDEAKIQGYEAKAVWEPNEKFKFVINYTYTDSEDKTTGYALPATPKNRLNGTIYWTPIERFKMYVGLETASERTMSSASDESVPGYVDAKIGASVRLFSYKGAHLYLKTNIYNLFNQNICMYKNIYTNEHYYKPGIRFNVGLFLKYNLPEKERT